MLKYNRFLEIEASKQLTIHLQNLQTAKILHLYLSKRFAGTKFPALRSHENHEFNPTYARIKLIIIVSYLQ